jgi:hypothetical protein
MDLRADVVEITSRSFSANFGSFDSLKCGCGGFEPFVQGLQVVAQVRP